MTVAMILAAGFGTRLRPLTEELPKPLVPVGDRPVLAHVAAHLVAGGVRRAVVNAHHLACSFTPELLASLPLEVSLSVEASILGTAGGLSRAAGLLGEGDVVAWNADILVEIDVPALTEAHAASGAEATLACAPRPSGEGTVGVGAAGEVVRLRGERFGAEVRGADFVGVQVVGRALRALLPPEGCLVGDVYLPRLRSGGRLATSTAPGRWDDIGSIESYLAANRRWLERRAVLAFLGAGAVVEPGVDPHGSVVGAGARVLGSGSLRGCVVWPGAVATAPLENAVVTLEGRVARA